MQISQISQISQITIGQILALIGGTTYAIFLCTEFGKKFDDDVVTRWGVVVVGVAIVGVSTMIDGHVFPWQMFVLAGLPLAARGMYYAQKRLQRVERQDNLQKAFDGND